MSKGMLSHPSLTKVLLAGAALTLGTADLGQARAADPGMAAGVEKPSADAIPSPELALNHANGKSALASKIDNDAEQSRREMQAAVDAELARQKSFKDEADRLAHDNSAPHHLDIRWSETTTDINVPDITTHPRSVKFSVPGFRVDETALLIPAIEVGWGEIGRGPGHPEITCGWDMKSLPFGIKTKIWGCHQSGWAAGPPIMGPTFKTVQNRVVVSLPQVFEETIDLNVPEITISSHTEHVKYNILQFKDVDLDDEKSRAKRDLEEVNKETPARLQAISQRYSSLLHAKISADVDEDIQPALKAIQAAEAKVQDAHSAATTVLKDARSKVEQLPETSRGQAIAKLDAAAAELESSTQSALQMLQSQREHLMATRQEILNGAYSETTLDARTSTLVQ